MCLLSTSTIVCHVVPYSPIRCLERLRNYGNSQSGSRQSSELGTSQLRKNTAGTLDTRMGTVTVTVQLFANSDSVVLIGFSAFSCIYLFFYYSIVLHRRRKSLQRSTSMYFWFYSTSFSGNLPTCFVSGVLLEQQKIAKNTKRDSREKRREMK